MATLRKRSLTFKAASTRQTRTPVQVSAWQVFPNPRRLSSAGLVRWGFWPLSDDASKKIASGRLAGVEVARSYPGGVFAINRCLIAATPPVENLYKRRLAASETRRDAACTSLAMRRDLYEVRKRRDAACTRNAAGRRMYEHSQDTTLLTTVVQNDTYVLREPVCRR